jgi:ketosteroid isomerase-like protein
VCRHRFTEPDITARTPQEAVALFQAAFNAGHIKPLLALYEPDAVFAPPDGQPVAGHAAIRGILAQLLALGLTMAFRITTVLEAKYGLALVTAAWHATRAGAPDDLFGTARIVLRRQPDGTWRYLIDDPGLGDADP